VSTRAPYRIAVWGPGVMGQCAIREVVRLPETELVGVLAYSAAKIGVDAGALAGIDNVGVKATTEAQEIVGLKPDCVIHTARDFGDYRCDDDIVMLLEAGINVISLLTYQYPAARGAEVEQRFIDAGKRGGATLHGNGIDPGFMYERLAALMTGLANDIQYIRLEEYFNVSSVGAEIIGLFGFGTKLAEIKENPVAATMASNYLTMGMHYLADNLGLPLKRIEQHHRHKLVDRDESIPDVFLAKAGTIGTVSYEWRGYTDDDKPMFQIQVYWYLNENLRPDGVVGDNHWIVEVEGVPSTRLSLEVKGSFAQNLALAPQNPAPLLYLLSIVPAVQAIPLVVDAEPGIYVSAMPDVHWKPDLRNQTARNSRRMK
jgi:2,4-diaminopentanoate dehydrogenase